VSLRLLESPDAAREATRTGVRRLFALQLMQQMKHLSRTLPSFERMALFYSPIGGAEELKRELVDAIVDRALYLDAPGGEVRTKEQFIGRAKQGWQRLSEAASEITGVVDQTLAEYHEVQKLLSQPVAPAWIEPFRDINSQLEHLMPLRFVTQTPAAWLSHLPRFLKAVRSRITKLMDAGVVRDANAMREVRPWWEKYLAKLAEHKSRGVHDPEMDKLRWMIEELRVSLFAQELKTSIPISTKRLEKQWELVRK
jgi:ATP-dependent helicase HrpA